VVFCEQDKKRDMAKIIDITNKTFERREKCISEMASLKAQVGFSWAVISQLLCNALAFGGSSV
jgi:hypothetical protein